MVLPSRPPPPLGDSAPSEEPSLPQAETNEAAADVLRYLPGRSVGTLLEAMAQQPDPAVRKQLVEVISGILPTAEPLAARIATSDPETSLLIVQIA